MDVEEAPASWLLLGHLGLGVHLLYHQSVHWWLSGALKMPWFPGTTDLMDLGPDAPQTLQEATCSDSRVQGMAVHEL